MMEVGAASALVEYYNSMPVQIRCIYCTCYHLNTLKKFQTQLHVHVCTCSIGIMYCGLVGGVIFTCMCTVVVEHVAHENMHIQNPIHQCIHVCVIVGIGPSTYNSLSIRNLNHKGYVRKRCNKNVYPSCTNDTSLYMYISS